MNFFTKILTIAGPRVLGAAAAWAATKLAEKGIVTDPSTLIGIALSAYAVVHKAVSSKVNPGDAASGRMATAEKEAAAEGSTVKVAAPTS